jgi:hypothetical protein
MLKFKVYIKKPQATFIGVLLLCGAFLCVNFLSLLASSQTQSNKSVKSQEPYKAPKVRFDDLSATDIEDRSVRAFRNRRYDKSSSQSLDQFPANATSRGLVSEWDVYLPALPVAESDVVVLGDVVDAKAFLSNDRTGAYSEFNIKVINVYKNDRTLNGELITAERQGAIVELPSGRTIEVEVIGQRMPQVGHRYVLFLKYNTETSDYFIVTGYEILGQNISPLDTIRKFAVYENADADKFLNELQAAIKNPPPPPIKRREWN